MSNPEISHENKYKLLSTAEPDKVKTEYNIIKGMGQKIKGWSKIQWNEIEENKLE